MALSYNPASRLACFELWGGNSKAVYPIELPGLRGWIYCTPFGHAERGGDVHYVSVCSKGQVSRIVVADVSGHGDSASLVANRLRQILQQHTDNWEQAGLMQELNEAFKIDATQGRFATAAVVGFYADTGELLFSNAGHSPLLWHHSQSRAWTWLEEGTSNAKDVAGLPLGLIAGTTYSQSAVEFRPGDTLLLYTDGITETRNESGEELGHEGLLALVREMRLSPDVGPADFGRILTARLKEFRGNDPQRDDETLVLVQRELASTLRGGNTMPVECSHLNQIQYTSPNTDGCEECLKMGDTWLHLRLCEICGHVGCCDGSKNRHATKHFRKTQHPIMRSIEPGEDWGWCYIDDLMIEPFPEGPGRKGPSS